MLVFVEAALVSGCSFLRHPALRRRLISHFAESGIDEGFQISRCRDLIFGVAHYILQQLSEVNAHLLSAK